MRLIAVTAQVTTQTTTQTTAQTTAQMGSCQNGGMIVGQDRYPKCHCSFGFKGYDCSQKVTLCEANPCRNGGSCSENKNGTFTCHCPASYYGILCEHRVLPCDSSPCNNGGSCTDDGISCFQCECFPGFKGSDCSTIVTPCEANLCKNGGKCSENRNGTFTCHCPASYYGMFCEHRGELGKSEKNPAASCKEIHDKLLSQNGKLKNGLYWIKTSADCSVQTYCDLLNDGWTLVGKVSGFVDRMHTFWLIKNHNVDALDSPALPSKVSCIDARYLATYHASTVMFASGDNQKYIGSKSVQWPLPQGRESDSLWTHSVGLSTVSKAKMNSVMVKAWNGRTQVCYQNKYGISPQPGHGGSYPSATYNTAGNTNNGDYCMGVGVQKSGRSVDGWSQNANGYDSPRSDSDWPNSRYNHGSPYVTVWLK